jgi:hypothetical protein
VLKRGASERFIYLNRLENINFVKGKKRFPIGFSRSSKQGKILL